MYIWISVGFLFLNSGLKAGSAVCLRCPPHAHDSPLSGLLHGYNMDSTSNRQSRHCCQWWTWRRRMHSFPQCSMDLDTKQTCYVAGRRTLHCLPSMSECPWTFWEYRLQTNGRIRVGNKMDWKDSPQQKIQAKYVSSVNFRKKWFSLPMYKTQPEQNYSTGYFRVLKIIRNVTFKLHIY